MKRNFRLSLILLSILLCLVAVKPACANTPDQAVKNFFAYVVANQFDKAWDQLSKPSQNMIVSKVSKTERIDRNEVQRLFDSSDPRVCDGFWKYFAESSRADILAQRNFTTENIVGNNATVTVEGGAKDLIFIAVKENGAWKFGLKEMEKE